MGFHVSTIHNLPVGQIEYFVHVLDISGGAHGRWIDENLSTLAASLGRNAGLVTGPRDLSNELYRFLSRNLESGFDTIEALLRSTTCLLISEGHLAHTNKPIHLIPVATSEQSQDAHDLITTLLDVIASALRAGQLQQLVHSLGTHELRLVAARGSVWVCRVRQLNNVVELKPNIAGIGMNLNAAIEGLLPPDVRRI